MSIYITVFFLLGVCMGRVYSLTVIISLLLLKRKAEADDLFASSLYVTPFRTQTNFATADFGAYKYLFVS